MTGPRQTFDSSASYTPLRRSKAPTTLTVAAAAAATRHRHDSTATRTSAEATRKRTTPCTAPLMEYARDEGSNGVVVVDGGQKGKHKNVVPSLTVTPDESDANFYTLENGEGKNVERGGGEGGEGERCRWGPVSPDCCQRLRRPVWMLVCLCWAGATQGVVVNGFVNVVISTVERRFELTSTESGVIASCYDIAAVLCLIPITYFGGRGRKPRYLAVGMFVLGVGSFVFSMPHWTSGLYNVGQAQDSVCSPGTNSTGTCSAGVSSLSNFKFVFYLGQLLHGVGATPLYTLGTTYLDDNLPVASSSLYQGIYYAFAILGPGIGYLAGGAMLNIFTDFDKVDSSKVTIASDNPRWVGAWWLGFLFSGTLAILIFVPLFGFPKSLPGAEKYQAEKEKEVYKGKAKDKDAGPETQPLGLRHILNSVRDLVTNPTFMFLNCAAATAGIILSGFSTFAPKYLEFQFSLTSGVAAQYVGMVAIPMAGGATFLGGWLTKRFTWSVRQILQFCVMTTLITECFILIFLIQCKSMPFAGVSASYGGHQPGSSGGSYQGSAVLSDVCNERCHCTMQLYNPVCGRDNVIYYSPCYAGCDNSSKADAKKYSNCSCVQYNFTVEDIRDSNLWMAAEGKCESDCPYLVPFLVVFGLIMIGIFVTSIPALSASLRCVAQDQRSFALGIQWIIARCLGSIPGPILLGKIIDTTCVVWQKSCRGDGACFYYDNKAMSHNILGLGLGFNFLSAVFFALALAFYRNIGNAVSLDLSTAGLEDEPAVPSHHTSMTTITQPSTPSLDCPSKDAAGSSLTALTQRTSTEDSRKTGDSGGGDGGGASGGGDSCSSEVLHQQRNGGATELGDLAPYKNVSLV